MNELNGNKTLNIQRIRSYMSTWAKYTYHQGVSYCRDSSLAEKQQCNTIIGIQNLSEKYMNGYSVEGIPVKYEGALKFLSYSAIFYGGLEKGYLTPASYIMNIIRDCNYQKVTDQNLITGIVGRGLRSFPAFIREMDLASKLLETLKGAECYRGNPQDDIVGHTDVFLNYNNEKYRLWSYQNTSERALTNTVSKIRGQRGQLPDGIYILCPFDYKDKNCYEDVEGWRLYNDNYTSKVKHIILEGETADYDTVCRGQYTRIKSYITKIQKFRKNSN